MYSETKQWLETCVTCAQKKGHKPDGAGLMQPIIAKKAFDIVGMDFFGPLPTTKRGHAYILLFTDHLTKWVEIFAAERAENKVGRLLVEGIICKHGVMNQLISDRGTSFVSEVITEVYKLFKIRKIHTSAWHSQANGQTKRFNKPLANMLSAYCDENQQNWDLHLPYVSFAYNSAVHFTIKVSPYKAMYGREPRFPFEISTGTATYVREQPLEQLQWHQILNNILNKYSIWSKKTLVLHNIR